MVLFGLVLPTLHLALPLLNLSVPVLASRQAGHVGVLELAAVRALQPTESNRVSTAACGGCAVTCISFMQHAWPLKWQCVPHVVLMHW